MKHKANVPSGTRHTQAYPQNRMTIAAKTNGAIAILLAAVFAGSVSAQDESARALAERSSIVVAGTVTEARASLEPLQAASERTVVIKISRMYAGAEIAGDQKGRTATVVLSRPSTTIKAGTEALFFGNPRFAGKSLTIASEGELLAGAATAAKADLELGLQARRDLPVRERLAVASSVFHGKVESEHAIAGAADQANKSREPPSEHDPDWHVASVRVIDALQGSEKGALVNVIFPASGDIMWVNSPKLKPGQEALFITHKPDKGDTRLMRAPGIAAFLEKQSAEVVSQPFDTLPPSDDARLRNLLAKGR